MNTFNGYAFITKIGTSCTLSVGAYAKVFLDTLGVRHIAKLDEHIGVNGETCALVHSNEYLEINASLRLASDVSEEEVEEDFTFLPKGSTVVLSGFKPLMFQVAPAPEDKTDVLNDPTGWILVGDTTLTRNASTDPGTADVTLRHYLSQQANLVKLVPVTTPPAP